MKTGLFLILCVLICSCSSDSSSNTENQSESEYDSTNSESSESTVTAKTPKNSKTFNGITYQFNLLSSIDYLKRKGENLSKKEQRELKDESVLIIKMFITDLNKEILKSELIQMNDEQKLSYLAQGISQDVHIESVKAVYRPNGSIYSGLNGAKNSVSVYLFFKGIDKKNICKVVFYDSLFGSGIIKTEIN